MRSFSGYLVAVSCWLYVVGWGAVGGPAAAENQVQLARQTYLRGEAVSVTVAGAREGLGLRLRGVTVPGSWNLALADDGSTRIDTAPYRVGDYALELRRGEETVESVGLYLRPAQRPEVWYGNFTSRPLSAGGDPYQELRDLGMNCAYLHGISPDEALRHGIYLVVHGNALRSVYTGLTDEQKRALGQVFMNCEGTTKAQDKVACMRNPEVIRMAGERVVESVQEMVGYPGVMGIGVDDEVGMHAYDWNDTGGVTCYCDSCRKLWKAKTGKEPPRPVCLPPGSIIPDKDPYLRYATEWTGWADYAGPAEADYNQAMVEKLHRVRPDWLVFQTPGGLYGEMDAVHWEIYSYWMSWPVTEALASMSYVRGHHQEKYGARKPIWPLLGWFQRTPAPEWTGNYIAAQVRMCMAEGAAGIWLTLMPWYDSGGRHKQAILAGMEHLAPAVRETGRMLEQYGPALIRITPTRYPVAVLRSRTTEMYQRVIDPKVIAAAKAEGSWTEVAWEHTQATGMGFGALLRAGAPAEFISEDDVIAGKLKDYQAVVLLDHKYAQQSTVDRLNEFAAGGGVVLADQGSPIKPEEAKVLPFDSAQASRMVNLGLRAARTPGERLDIVFNRTTGLEREWALLAQPVLQKELPAAAQAVTSSNRQIIARLGSSGDTEYLYVLNADVQNEQSALISARTRGGYAYDLFGGNTAVWAALDGALKLQATVPAGGWRVYAITPAPLGGVTVAVKEEQGQVTVEAAVVDQGQQTVAGAFPIRLTVADARGQVLPYGGYFGTEGGRLEHTFRTAVNDPAGVWKILATNLATGQTAEAELNRAGR